MGKDLKGRECGKGLSQRSDGRYSARFVSKSGKRLEKYFSKLAEARKWLADTQYEDRHKELGTISDIKTYIRYQGYRTGSITKSSTEISGA